MEKGKTPHSSILAWRIHDRGAGRVTVHAITELDMTEQLTHTHTYAVWYSKSLKTRGSVQDKIKNDARNLASSQGELLIATANSNS